MTCVAITSDETTVYSGSKDNSLLSWDLATAKKKGTLKKHWTRQENPTTQALAGEVLAVAVSSDGRLVASGGRDKVIRVYDTRTALEVGQLQGHRDAVTCLAFREGSAALYSGSLDRTLKHWEVGEMAYVETLFGHQVIAVLYRASGCNIVNL